MRSPPGSVGQFAPVPQAKFHLGEVVFSYMLVAGFHWSAVVSSYTRVVGSFLSARLIIPKLVLELLPFHRFV